MRPRPVPSTNPTLLLVDDDENARAELRFWLSRHGFDVHEVIDGRAVAGLLGRRRWDLILLDIEMPGLSGLEVLQQIRERHPPDVLPVMMATAKDTSLDIVRALNAGANDYVTKPFDLPVVLARVRTQVALAHARNDLAQANRRMRQELEAAARVQAALLPRPRPHCPGFACAWHYRPCTELAGDLLGLLPLRDGRVCLYVLDVVHHGVKAALWAVMVNRALSGLLADGPGSPVEVAEALNAEFPWDDRTEQFFSLQLGLIHPDEGIYRFVTAGHPGPIVVRADGQVTVSRIESSLIGLTEGGYEEHSLTLEPGDRLYLFSDGLIEAHDAQGSQIGRDRAAAILREARAQTLERSLEHLTSEVLAWIGPGNHPHDDISIVAVERQPKSVRVSTEASPRE